MKRSLLQGLVIQLCLAFMVITAVPSIGQCKEKKEDLLRDLYKNSGMKKQCEQVPSLLSAGFEQAAAQDIRLQALPKGFLQNIRLSIDSVFKAENFEKAIMEEMRKTLDVKDMKKVSTWLNSETGKKLALMEEVASTAGSLQEQQTFLQNFDPEKMPEKRKALYQKLDKATNATTFNTEMVLNMQLAMTIAIVATLPEEQQPSRDQILKMIDQTRPQVEQAIAAQTFASFLFIYRKASMDELEQYIAFASTPEGALFNKSTMAGFQKAILDGSFAWGGIIADMLNQKTTQTEI